MKCATFACVADGVHPYVERDADVYCVYCADDINRACVDKPYPLVVRNTHDLSRVIRAKLVEPLCHGHWDGPLTIKALASERFERVERLTERLLKSLDPVDVANKFVVLHDMLEDAREERNDARRKVARLEAQIDDLGSQNSNLEDQVAELGDRE